jgi:hypothetical protein
MFALIFLVAVAVLAWVLAGRAEQRERERSGEAAFWKQYALDELKAMRDEAC